MFRFAFIAAFYDGIIILNGTEIMNLDENPRVNKRYIGYPYDMALVNDRKSLFVTDSFRNLRHLDISVIYR